MSDGGGDSGSKTDGLYDDVDDVKLAATNNATTAPHTTAATTTTTRRIVRPSSTIPTATRTHGTARQPPHFRGGDDDDDRPIKLSLTDLVVDLQATVNRLQQENEVLKRNMGTLFRTATAELARKDRQLHDLTQRQREELELAVTAAQQQQQREQQQQLNQQK